MLFVYGYHKYYIKKKASTLQVRQNCFFIRPHHKERAVLSAFKGSLTVEAALVVPLFIISITVIIKFFMLMDFQNILQQQIENASRILPTEYATVENLYKGYNIMTGDAGEMSDAVGVIGGRYGMMINTDSDKLDENISCIGVSYIWQPCKIIGLGNINIRFKQKIYYIEWLGKSLEDSTDEITGDEIVYVTENGTVYHTSRECTYLVRAIQVSTAYQMENYRNLSGGKYYKCEKCTNKDTFVLGTVYFTSYGDRYHSSKSCSTLIRYIKEVRLSEVGNLKKCSKCN